MAQQNKWKYCEKTTNQHSIYIKGNSYIEPIHDVIAEEGQKRNPFTDEVCINLDKYEGYLAQKEKRGKRKTMDISFGVKLGRDKRTVLCELRLNYKNVNNLRKKELDSKIDNTKNIVGHNPVIYTPFIFVFSKKIKNQAFRTLRRLYSNRTNMLALDIDDLKNKYF